MPLESPACEILHIMKSRGPDLGSQAHISQARLQSGSPRGQGLVLQGEPARKESRAPDPSLPGSLPKGAVPPPSPPY